MNLHYVISISFIFFHLNTVTALARDYEESEDFTLTCNNLMHIKNWLNDASFLDKLNKSTLERRNQEIQSLKDDIQGYSSSWINRKVFSVEIAEANYGIQRKQQLIVESKRRLDWIRLNMPALLNELLDVTKKTQKQVRPEVQQIIFDWLDLQMNELKQAASDDIRLTKDSFATKKLYEVIKQFIALELNPVFANLLSVQPNNTVKTISVQSDLKRLIEHRYNILLLGLKLPSRMALDITHISYRQGTNIYVTYMKIVKSCAIHHDAPTADELKAIESWIAKQKAAYTEGAFESNFDQTFQLLKEEIALDADKRAASNADNDRGFSSGNSRSTSGIGFGGIDANGNIGWGLKF
jgi:hypothetical protein